MNLANGSITKEPVDKYVKEWLGGPGFAVKILYDELRSWVTPYDPNNKLIFGAGTLQGTTAPGANKMNVSTLSPVTGGWGSSCSDSYLGGQLKYAGYDSVVIEGRAKRPVYLWINDGKVELRDALSMWGKTTRDTFDMVRQDLGDPSLHVAAIGPAGENLVRGACIMQDRGRAFGRCGTGAVMGSKNLKAFVARGSGSIQIADSARFMRSVAEARNMCTMAKSSAKTHEFGTLFNYNTKQEVCGINYKNFQFLTVPDEQFQTIDPRKTIKKYEISKLCFPGCAINGCGRRLLVTDGPYAGLKTESNQWEAFSTLQTRLAVEEPTFMLQANSLCNDLGVDVDAAGGAIGWAMECYQRKIIDERDTGGLALEWGDGETVLKLIRQIAYREGFGDILAEGSYRAADIIGRDSLYYAIHIKKQDLYEVCRGAIAYALGTTTSTRGGGHTTGAVACEAAPGLDVEKAKMIYGVNNPNKPLEYEGKAIMTRYMEVLHRVNNCLGVCHINTTWWDVDQIDLPQLAELYSAATGIETTVDELRKIAVRQLNLEKAFNLRHTDLSRKDDLPSERDLREPIPGGKLAGWKMDKKRYGRMLDEYYELHGWDKQTGFPKQKTLDNLNLGYVAEDLRKIGKLG